jgi:hypothetical protein
MFNTRAAGARMSVKRSMDHGKEEALANYLRIVKRCSLMEEDLEKP